MTRAGHRHGDLAILSQLLGGIGLFLLGMVLMTDGLKSAAGDSLRSILSRFTGGRWKAFFTGLGITAVVQSSSATTLATIGFVSAGLLTFTQAVGVVIGASVGTTTTSWVVSVLGLKFSITAFAMPLVGVGALAKLLLRGKAATLGLVLAGFGMIFVGIDFLKVGMDALSAHVDFTRVPGETLWGRGVLVLIGIAMTVVMQSSSAAVAITMAAFFAGTITLDQGAALIIGQSVGTTVTAAIATIGAGVPARRTALAHILFNVSAATMAFVLVPAYLWAVHSWEERTGDRAGTVTLALFHTGFIGLGALVFVPLSPSLARAVERILPDRTPSLTRHLDPTVRSAPPAVAVEAARRTVMETAGVVFTAAGDLIAGTHASGEKRNGRERASAAAMLAAADGAMDELRRFLEGVVLQELGAREGRRHVSTLHAMDHIDRLIEALREGRPRALGRDEDVVPGMGEAVGLARGSVERAGSFVRGEDGSGEEVCASVEAVSKSLAELRRTQREGVLARTAEGKVGAVRADEALGAMRWLDRVGYHTWRAVRHLVEAPAQAES